MLLNTTLRFCPILASGPLVLWLPQPSRAVTPRVVPMPLACAVVPPRAITPRCMAPFERKLVGSIIVI